jgi:iron(III) transport system permease protein
MFKQGFGFWSVVSLLLALIVLSPVAIIFVELFRPVTENWNHVLQYVLVGYIKNSFILIFGVVSLASIIGIGTSWLVTQFDFFGKKYIEWLMLMPLAIPTYIMAYCYAGIFLLLTTHHIIPVVDIKNIYGLIFILSFALYPYIYSVCKVSFSIQNASLLEASKTMGKGSWATFFKVALPLSRTAIIGGMSLVVMELLNDYGAVKYFGIDTITTGIFRTWFSMGDLNTAIRICAIALLIVMVFLAAERIQRNKKNIVETASASRKLLQKKLKGFYSATAFFICLLPILFGFIFPLLQIIYWTILTASHTFNLEFFGLLFNTITLASIAAILCIVAGIIFNFSKNWELSWALRIFTRLSTTGYAIPGAVIAIGILVPALYIDKNFSASYSLLNYTVVFLLFAYVVRFIAVSNNALESNFKKISPQLTAAARMMGKSSFATLFKVHLPLVTPGLLSAFLLVFVEVIKELPLTLILRPFDYNTLATKCFEMASDERVAEAGNYALVIIATGLIPVVLLNRFSSKKK